MMPNDNNDYNDNKMRAVELKQVINKQWHKILVLKRELSANKSNTK